jgi:hypothetical protein
MESTTARLSDSARACVVCYGLGVCVGAFALYRMGEGTATIAKLMGMANESQASCAVVAGREIDAACKSRLA